MAATCFRNTVNCGQPILSPLSTSSTNEAFQYRTSPSKTNQPPYSHGTHANGAQKTKVISQQNCSAQHLRKQAFPPKFLSGTTIAICLHNDSPLRSPFQMQTNT